jgi:hypothetical protein
VTVTTTTPESTVTAAEDAAAFKAGRGFMLAGLIGAGVLALAGLWLLLSHGDQARVYGELGRRINGVRQAQFDEFWSCALRGRDPRDVHNNAELTSELEASAADGGREYGDYLRENCAGMLAEITPALDQLIVPDDLKADVDTLKAATGTLERNLRAFIGCLSAAQPCDRAASKPSLDGIARGWFDFQTAHAAVNKTIRSRLEKP